MSILKYNGGAVVAMVGKNCVAIAADKRLSLQYNAVSSELQKIFPITDKIYIGLPGLATDVQTLSELFRFKCNMYRLREEREIEPSTLANMVASTLYGRRFSPYFAEPIIAGLDKNNKPFICGMDVVGCISDVQEFVLSGACEEGLYGMCEALWQPDLEPEELFETISQCLLSAVDRDCLSGWGAIVHVITPERVITRTLKMRMD